MGESESSGVSQIVIERFDILSAISLAWLLLLLLVSPLTANGFCLFLLQHSKDREAHMQASMIFTSNDIIINFGVIMAGVLVMWLDSSLPDLVVGGIVFLVVMRGALRILKLAK